MVLSETKCILPPPQEGQAVKYNPDVFAKDAVIMTCNLQHPQGVARHLQMKALEAQACLQSCKLLFWYQTPVVRTRHGLYAQHFIASTQFFEKNLRLPVLLNPAFACPAETPWSCTQWSVSRARLRAVEDTLHRLAKFRTLSISSAYCDASHCHGGVGQPLCWHWPSVTKAVWLQIQRLPVFGSREWRGVEAVALQPIPQYQPRSVIKPGI